MSGTVTYQEAGDTFTYATFTPAAPLAPSTRYVAMVTSGITDRAGNHLPGAVTWEFTTGPAGTGAWNPTSLTNAPAGSMVNPFGVWTGSDVLVWDAFCTCGGRYDPVTDTWRAMSAAGGPTDRLGETAVWTGSQLIVWGGEIWGPGGYAQYNTGWRYDAATDSWTAISTTGAPEGRTGHVALWTGLEMLVWGGRTGDVFVPIYLTTGGRYDPETDSWSPMSAAGAPFSRLGPTAVWTGTEMIVWGGGRYVSGTGATLYLSDGGRYNPATDTWQPTSTAGVPSGRVAHTVVWTGSEMIVWGGLSDLLGFGFLAPVELNSGGRYDPVADTWSLTRATGAPRERSAHTAVWTGGEMIIWGGYVGGTYWSYPVYGGRYDPATDTWRATTPSNAPAGRSEHAAAWTGREMIVWGGTSGTPLRTGGRYTP